MKRKKSTHKDDEQQDLELAANKKRCIRQQTPPNKIISDPNAATKQSENGMRATRNGSCDSEEKYPEDCDTYVALNHGSTTTTLTELPQSHNFGLDTPSKNIVLNKRLFETPVKSSSKKKSDSSTLLQKNINRSARKKITRNLIERTTLGNISDEDENDEDLAEKIYCSEEDVDELTDAPPKTPKGTAGKVTARTPRRSPTPPKNLTDFENYFYQNKQGRPKTSNNKLTQLELLDHEEYFKRSRKIVYQDQSDIERLERLHADDFPRWQFELCQGFNLCLYGFGSKRTLLMKFADNISRAHLNKEKFRIVVVNGYVNSLSINDILKTIASSITSESIKVGSLSDMLETLFGLIEQDKAWDITLVIHSIDGISIRRLAHQTILSRLSAHPQIHLVASADHPLFPLLWDSCLRSTFNFIFHDCTTFRTYDMELDVVEEAHKLLGRSGRRAGGKEGVNFVLKSLPVNAKNLFRILIAEQLIAMDNNSDNFDEDRNMDRNLVKSKKPDIGVEYRALYQRAEEEFICSNEMNFRTLLKEFHDHQMVESRRDAFGTEILFLPFRKEELEDILEDIMSQLT
ncbi:BgTH12-07920 [Blumeria graminis f. sp. triticale]|uniref:Origin recognition complex subunit 2 n=3 Tax=Blumeria graminis TaxID=34373 RepID=A0A061HMK2_BLUGR|nr:Subunit of the origin recognition complex [Blumeria graminis f. sp. tritici 96224]CAD6502088.1 BgTH12-07920 [Blumeria graminis f. sp. triticale]VDB86066.1 Bgt-120 [Blumeria graminis f. sp. tritici]